MFEQMTIHVIRWYQHHLSPDHSPRRVYFPFGYCRYQPTCSQYTIGAIERYGLVKGGLKGLWRIVRCNPWSKGGDDPI